MNVCAACLSADCLDYCPARNLADKPMVDPWEESNDGSAHRLYTERFVASVLTKQLQFGRSEPKSVDGPLFAQPGLFD